ncbi:MAG: hypothetical protein QXW35_03550 [Candidatus Aenigmatarchaeota archaeon]
MAGKNGKCLIYNGLLRLNVLDVNNRWYRVDYYCLSLLLYCFIWTVFGIKSLKE